ncbi:hypothetical protein Cni_G07626 [Canna indica]|uniref:RING-type E3 ubiquitin transferase n=1 Tax=Canna indica TaxID=4628 RepID=A0AAQ3JYT7_9LILI|nr:hypothetical protein Cni_G07626 [Canna indica]
MASNSPPQSPREEEEQNEESQDEDYDPFMDDSVADSHPDQDYLEFLERHAQANEVVEAVVERGGSEGGETKGFGGSNGVDLDRSLSPSCSVCFGPWSSDGPHRVCCIPCGHVYGRSCLEKWLGQCGKNNGKCPQCNRKFRQKDIINLYAPQIAVPNDDLEKEVRCLREENKALKLEVCYYVYISVEFTSHHLCKMACVKHTWSDLNSKRRRHSKCSKCFLMIIFYVLSEKNCESRRDDGFHPCSFALQNELKLDGARVMGIDGSIVIVSGKSPQIQQEHVITKISLLSPNEVDKIQLPPSTKAIRDLSILPGGLALLASLGKKLLLLSMTSNNLVLKYDLPAPAWSCSGDYSSPNFVYSGLQNGMLLVFDIRQTAVPMQIIEGLSRHPVHTLHSLVPNDGCRRVLTASSSGPCVWEVGSDCGRPLLIPEMENRGVCISLASSSSLDGAVASFRPKVELFNDMIPSPTPVLSSPILSTQGKIGSHILIKGVNSLSFHSHEVGKSMVSEIRMPKSAIVCHEGSNSAFAYADESSRRVHVWGLPSFNMYAKLKPHQNPILDLSS